MLTIVIGLLVAVGIIGFFGSKSATYTAEATLVVGRIDVPSNAVPGYTSANNTLAGSYSRFVGTDLHLEKMAELASSTREEIRASGRVSGSNVPDSAIVRLRATADSADQAVKLADLGAAALVELVASVNDPTDKTKALLEEHASVASSKAKAQATVERLQRDLAFHLNAGRGTEAANVQAELDIARTDFEQQVLKLNTISTLYQESQRGRIEGAVIKSLDSAGSNGGTRGSDLALGVVGGVVGGLLLGAATAWFAANGPILLALRRGMIDRQDAEVRAAGPMSSASWYAPEFEREPANGGSHPAVRVPDR